MGIILPKVGALRCFIGAITAISLSGCGGGGSGSSNAQATTLSPLATQAAASTMIVSGSDAGASPFIAAVHLSGHGISNLAGIEFTIAPKPGSVSKPVDVWYSITALSDRGFILPPDVVVMPVFGLYAGYANQVTLQLHFQDGSAQTLAATVDTADYVDPTGIYSKPTILVPRASGSALGFDFFVIKSAFGSPVILDTDGEIRWVAPGPADSAASAMQGDEFVIGDPDSLKVTRLRLDGSSSGQSLVSSSTLSSFNHNIDPGKEGLFAELSSSANVETTITEITDQGAVLNQWDFAAIISAYMTSQGDDASAFVRPGVDWFHSNSSTYDPSDDTVIVSSRENFLIKVDYHTGNIIWILGDPTKYWYTFPSLRAKALTLAAGGLYPIGQHAVSITSDGLLMVMNDGDGSANQPAGEPAGITRTYSAVSAYSIDESSMTAVETWDFSYGQAIYSPICGSAYESAGQSYLLDYAVADNGAQVRLVGLDSNQNVVFDFAYAQSTLCSVSWNSLPIALNNFTIS